MKENNNLRKGVTLALVASLISGISIFYNKLVVVSGIDSVTFNIVKNGGVALILSALVLKNKPNLSELIFNKKLIILGVIGGSIPFLLFFEGLKHVPAVNANLIQKTLFIWVAMLAIPLLSEKLKPAQIIGYLLVIYGNFFIGGLSGFKFSVYEGMILAATLFWSVEYILARKILSRADAATAAWGRMFFGTIVLIAYAALNGNLTALIKLTPDKLLPVAGSVAFLTLYVVSFYKALKYAPATVVTSILILATPVTNILSSIFVTHNFPQTMAVSTLILTLGVFTVAFFMPGLFGHGKYNKNRAES